MTEYTREIDQAVALDKDIAELYERASDNLETEIERTRMQDELLDLLVYLGRQFVYDKRGIVLDN